MYSLARMLRCEGGWVPLQQCQDRSRVQNWQELKYAGPTTLQPTPWATLEHIWLKVFRVGPRCEAFPPGITGSEPPWKMKTWTRQLYASEQSSWELKA